MDMDMDMAYHDLVKMIYSTVLVLIVPPLPHVIDMTNEKLTPRK